MRQNVILFPGFSQNETLYGDYEYADIWDKKLSTYNLNNKEYIVGHSMGSLSALIHWRIKQETTIILFNPLIPKRKNINILSRFIYMLFTSPGTIKSIKGMTSIKHLPITLMNAFSLLKNDPIDIITKVPKEKLIIIKGENDKYFFDNDSVEYVRGLGIDPIILKNVGHYWDKDVDEYLKNNILK